MGFVICLVGVGVAIWAACTYFDQQRSRFLREVADVLNVKYERNLDARIRLRLSDFSLLRNKGALYRSWEHALVQSVDGDTVVVFDHLVVDNQCSYALRSVAYLKLSVRRLPSFLLRPKGSMDRFTALFGTKDICNDVDCRQQDSEFCRRYFLAGNDPAAICDVFDSPLRTILVQTKECSVEANGDELIVVHNSLLAPDELPIFRETVIALAQLLRNPPAATDARTALHIPIGA